METRINKIWKDVQTGARDFASRGLAVSSKALGTTATRLKHLEETLKHRAEKLHAAKIEVVAADTHAKK